MNNFSPRPTLPDTWAEKSHCPICGMIPLWVMHQKDAPDEMNCPRCGTAFRVENAGLHLFLTQTPPGYQQALAEKWLPAKTIRAFTKQHPWKPNSQASAIVSPQIPDAPPATPEVSQSNPAEPAVLPEQTTSKHTHLIAKARELHELGNSRTTVRTILMETEDDLSIEEIEDILNAAFEEVEKKNSGKNRTLMIVGGILAFLCLCGIMVVVIVRNLTSSLDPIMELDDSQPAIGQSETKPQTGLNIPFLPDSIQQLAPILAGEAPTFPTPQVVQGPASSQRSTCPVSADQAARLFGGKAAGWTLIPDPPSWYSVSLTPLTVTVPAGMIGQVMVLGDNTGSMETIYGPATVQNTNMIIIMCE